MSDMEFEDVEVIQKIKKHLQRVQNIYDTLEAKQDLDDKQEDYLVNVLLPSLYRSHLKTDTEDEPIEG